MITDSEKEELIDILSQKHYQHYHPVFKNYIEKLENYKDEGVLHANTYDDARLKFISEKLNIEKFKVLDIGANIGFFTIASIVNGALEVDSVESDHTGARLIELQSKALNIEEQIKMDYLSYDFTVSPKKKYDLTFCLNVLHHVGRYFGAKDITKDEAKNLMIEYLDILASGTKYCWYQMGYNWKGDESLPLFDNGSKQEVINFLEKNIKNWEILEIGIMDAETEQYVPGKNNLGKFFNLGEFGNRPLFLLKSKLFN